MKGVQRVNIQVKETKVARKLFENLLGGEWYDHGRVMGRLNCHMGWNVGIELIGPHPDRPDSPFAQRVKEEGEGVNAVVFYIDDAEKEAARLKALGIRVRDDHEVLTPSKWPAGWRKDTGVWDAVLNSKIKVFDEIFPHPEDCYGVHVILGQIEREVAEDPAKGVNRVVIAVKKENRYNVSQRFSELLGGEWYDLGLVGEGQCYAMWNWDAGIELVAPNPKHPDSAVARHIREKGEGFMAVSFRVDDLEKAAARAKALGIRETARIKLDPSDGKTVKTEDGKLAKAVVDSKVKMFEEVILSPEDCHGVTVILGRIEREE